MIFLLPFLDILYFCFNLFIAFLFLFLFLRDTDSRKGTLCPFCVPIHKKEKRKSLPIAEITARPMGKIGMHTPAIEGLRGINTLDIRFIRFY